MPKTCLFFIVFFTYAFVFAYQQNYLRHQVLEGETIETIATFYHVTTAEILQLNPEVNTTLKKNTILLIPIKNSASLKNVTAQTEVNFTTHKVRKKETLYGIAKQYQVSVEELKRYNEELYERALKKGEKIRIPVYKIVQEENKPMEGIAFHIVQPQETKWGIAHSYGITVAKLQEFNPDMREVLKIGDTLYLSKKEEILKTTLSEEYIFYEVKPQETLYSLTRSFVISLETLKKLNPELEDGLKAGMVLKLPKTKSETLDIKNTVAAEKNNLAAHINKNRHPNLVLMLPLKLNTTPVDSVDTVKKRLKSDKIFSYALDFYSGALLAIDSVKQLGLSVNVKVFDTEGNESKVEDLARSHNFENTDAVIGPFYTLSFNALSEALKKYDVPVLSPLNEKNIKINDNVFQTVPSEDYLREKMIDFMVDNSRNKQLIIIADAKNTEIKNKLQSKLPAAQIIMLQKDKSIMLPQLSKMLSAEKENWVVLETDSESLVANVTSVLNSINRTKYRTTLLTTRKTDVFDGNSISNIHLSNLSFHYPTIDKLSSLDNPFSKKYEAEFYTTPNRYAIRGFDITFDVLLRLAHSENLYKAAREVGETEYVENKFDYDKNFFGGYHNKAFYIVKYEHLEIKEVPQ